MPLLITGADGVTRDVAATLLALGYTLKIRNRAGDLTPAVGAPPTRPTAGLFGERLTGAPAAVGGRTIKLDCRLDASSATTLELAKDALTTLCLGGVPGSTVVSAATSPAVAFQLTPDGGGNGRQFTGYLSAAADVTRVAPTGLAKTADVVLVFTCPDPLATSTSLTSAALAHSTNTTLTLGTAPSWPVFTLPGPLSDVHLYLKEPTFGVVVADLDVAGALGSGETLEIDAGAQSIVRINNTTGARTPANTWLFSGDFFALDPAYTVAGVPPYVFTTLSGGTSPGAAVAYRRAWR